MRKTFYCLFFFFVMLATSSSRIITHDDVTMSECKEVYKQILEQDPTRYNEYHQYFGRRPSSVQNLFDNTIPLDAFKTRQRIHGEKATNLLNDAKKSTFYALMGKRSIVDRMKTHSEDVMLERLCRTVNDLYK